uniref:Type 4 fimbrial biogenesis protein PilX N-terminal domain-containing protein n=1 Tax=Geobacter metallireducens TaxID=28232 RepID=A0A831UBM4_GEOME
MGRRVLNERGAALVVAIMLLMVLTVLMAVLHRTTLFEMVSSRAYQESQRAFYAADAGVRDALRWLGELDSPPESTLDSPEWFHDGTVAPADAAWSSWQTVDNLHFRYYIEHLKDAPNYHVSGTIGKDSKGPKSIQHYYRITVQGANSFYLVHRQVQVVTTAVW